PEVEKRLDDVLKYGDLTHASAQVIKPLLEQARLLARQHDAVVANPPYMGSKYFAVTLKSFVNAKYRDAKADLITCFMMQASFLVKSHCYVGMITLQNWMFLSSFEEVRNSLLASHTFESMIHNGRGAFGVDYGTTCFIVRKLRLNEYKGVFRRLL